MKTENVGHASGTLDLRIKIEILDRTAFARRVRVGRRLQNEEVNLNPSLRTVSDAQGNNTGDHGRSNPPHAFQTVIYPIIYIMLNKCLARSPKHLKASKP